MIQMLNVQFFSEGVRGWGCIHCLPLRVNFF